MFTICYKPLPYSTICYKISSCHGCTLSIYKGKKEEEYNYYSEIDL